MADGFVAPQNRQPQALTPTTAKPISPVPPSLPHQASTRPSNNPWGVDSELDRQAQIKKQVQSDEAFARKLQQEEEDTSKGRRPAHKNANPKPNPFDHASDPFTALDGPGKASSRQQPAPHVQNKQPLNLGAGSRKTPRSAGTVVDPAQLRSAQQRLGGSSAAIAAAANTNNSVSRSALDAAFGVESPKTPQPVHQQQQQQRPQTPASPRPRPTAKGLQSAKPQPQSQHQHQHQQLHQQQNIPVGMAPLIPTPTVGSPQPAVAGLGGLTTNAMAAAAASGNNAQVEKLEQMARAKAQELSAQEARIKQQQEEIRKQALFLQQQQQQLLQMQQTQKVEAQLKQLKEEKERFEQQRQANALKQQVELLKSQQDQLLKMQQMASQVRGNIAAGTIAHNRSASSATIPTQMQSLQPQ
ncbi:hypothetical protein GGI12_005276, partial [Dipsacomyces acuminosporus]